MAFENGAGVVPVMDINRGGYGYGDYDSDKPADKNKK